MMQLEQIQDDISVTRFLDSARPDKAVSNYLGAPPAKNLEQVADDISVTKFLGQRSNDIVVTMFNLDTTVTKFLYD